MSKKEKTSKEFFNKGKEKLHKLILFNDNINTVQHVIQCLILYLKHDPNQAEQCAIIAHFKGKCDIKNGSLDELKRFHEILLKKGLKVSII